MKVSQLIEQLEKCDPSLEVICICEDLPTGHSDGPLVFELESISAEKVVTHRGSDGRPCIKYGCNDETAKEYLIIEIVSDI